MANSRSSINTKLNIMDRLTLEQINNMTESQMREYLRGLEIENQRKDMAARIAAEEEQRKKEENEKFMQEYFANKFENNIKPRFNGQY